MKFLTLILAFFPRDLHAFTTTIPTTGGAWTHHHAGIQQKYDTSSSSMVRLFPSRTTFDPVPMRSRRRSVDRDRMHLGMTSTSSSNVSASQELDTEAIAKYFIALITQMSLISGFFYALDTILPMVIGTNTLPTVVTWIMCYLFSLKSRVFNPLNNARPDRQKAIKEGKSDGFKDRNQPSWTPPGVVFPIMWLLIIGPLRATSSTLIVNSMNGYFTLPLLSLMLHLSFGDIWNTINNTEKRYGTSVLGIVFVYLSALHAAWRYYQVDPLAGKLLGATAIWLTVAGALITEIWRLNPADETTGEKESLLPRKQVGEDSVTTFAWGEKRE